jgi:hypothetical protein
MQSGIFRFGRKFANQFCSPWRWAQGNKEMVIQLVLMEFQFLFNCIDGVLGVVFVVVAVVLWGAAPAVHP